MMKVNHTPEERGPKDLHLVQQREPLLLVALVGEPELEHLQLAHLAALVPQVELQLVQGCPDLSTCNNQIAMTTSRMQ